MPESPSSSPARVFGLLALLVLLGVPMVAYLWETLHALLSFHAEPLRLLISAGVLALFAGLLTFVGRGLSRQLLS